MRECLFLNANRFLNGSDVDSLQVGEFSFCLLEDGDVRARVFPQDLDFLFSFFARFAGWAKPK